MDKVAHVTTVFFSYSRSDIAVVDTIAELLDRIPPQNGLTFDVLIDRRDLPLGEEWRSELLNLIERADAIVFVASPSSIGSQWCAWELEQVQRLSKRLIPIMVEPVDQQALPPAIGNRQVLSFADLSPGSEEFVGAVASLAKTLWTDHAWIKEHSRLGDRARQWANKERDSSLLLRGSALRDAETWIDARPPGAPHPSEDILELALASRRAGQRRQRIGLFAATAIALVAFGLSAAAMWQRNVAQRQTALAIENDRIAETERGEAQRSHARFLADLSFQATKRGDPIAGSLLALEAMPDPDRQLSRPLVPEARQAIHESVWGQRLLGSYRRLPIDDLTKRTVARVLEFARTKTTPKLPEGADPTWGNIKQVIGPVAADLLKSYVNTVAISPDGRHLAIDYMDGHIAIRDAETGKITDAGNCDPATDDRLALDIVQSKSLARWPVGGGLSVYRRLQTSSSNFRESLCYIGPANEKRLLTTHAGSVTLIDLTTSRALLRRKAHKDNAIRIADWGRGPFVVIGDTSGVTEVVHLIAGQTAGLNRPSGSTAQSVGVNSGAGAKHYLYKRWRANGALLCDGNRLLRAREGRILPAIEYSGFKPQSCDPSEKANRFAVFFLSEDGRKGIISLIDASTGKELRRTALALPPQKNIESKKKTAVLGDADDVEALELFAWTRPEFDKLGRLYRFNNAQTNGIIVLAASDGKPIKDLHGINSDQDRLNAFTKLSRSQAKWQQHPFDGVEELSEITRKLAAAIPDYSGDAAVHPNKPVVAIYRAGSDQVENRFIEIWDLRQKRVLQVLALPDKASESGPAIFFGTSRGQLYVHERMGTQAIGDDWLYRLTVWGEVPVARKDPMGMGVTVGTTTRWVKQLDLDKFMNFQTLMSRKDGAERIAVVKDYRFGVELWTTDTTGSGIRTIRISEGTDNAPLVDKLAFTAKGGVLAGVANGAPMSWDLTTLTTPRRSLPTALQPTGGASPKTPDALPYVVRGNTEVAKARVWSPDTNTYRDLQNGGDVGHIDVMAGHLVSVGRDGKIRIIDAASLHTKHIISLPSKAASQLALAEGANLEAFSTLAAVIRLSPNLKDLLMPGENGAPTLFDLESGKPRIALEPSLRDIPEIFKELKAPAELPVTVAAFSPNGDTLAGAYLMIPQVTLWDAATGKIRWKLKGGTLGVTALAFSPDGQRLATANADGSIRLWNVARGQEPLVLTGHASSVRAIAFDADGQRLASASSDGTIRIWKLFANDAEIVRYARRSMPYCLGEEERSRYFLTPDEPAWCRGPDKGPLTLATAVLRELGLNSKQLIQALKERGGKFGNGLSFD